MVFSNRKDSIHHFVCHGHKIGEALDSSRISQGKGFQEVLNKLRTRRNRRHFADNILKCISWLKMFEFRLKFHWSLFPINNITALVQIMVQATSHHLNWSWLVYRHIYAPLGLNEFNWWKSVIVFEFHLNQPKCHSYVLFVYGISNAYLLIYVDESMSNPYANEILRNTVTYHDLRCDILLPTYTISLIDYHSSGSANHLP